MTDRYTYYKREIAAFTDLEMADYKGVPIGGNTHYPSPADTNAAPGKHYLTSFSV